MSDFKIMTTTPVHFGFNTFMYYLMSLIFPISFIVTNLPYFLLASLIDLDHLFSKPIYKLKRNPFKTHFLHKNWKFVLLTGIILLFINYPIRFTGFALISHIFVDFLYTKYWLKLD